MLKWNNGSEHQMENAALNAKTKTTALNAELKQRLWTPNGEWTMALSTKQKANNGSERQMENA